MISTRTMRRGVSLVEVIVVCGIVAVLFGLLVPAVMRIRESAARTSCQNNLKQIVMAAHAYDSTHGSLPPGYLGNLPVTSSIREPSFWKAQWIGSLAFLLPELGRSDLHSRIRTNWNLETAGASWFDNAENIAVAKSSVTTFLCPSDNAYSNKLQTVTCVGFFSENDRAGTVSGFLPVSGAGAGLGRTNYVGVAGKFGRTQKADYDSFEGVFYNRSRVGLATVTQQDGTSNVLMFGESLPDAAPGRRDYAFAWMGVGCIPSVGGVSSITPTTWSFSSAHADVVQFALCDGSVRAIKKNSNLQQFINLSAYHDGNPADPDTLGN